MAQMGRQRRSEIFYESLIVFQCAIFGFSFVALQKLISYGFPTFTIMCLRFFIGAISLLSICILSPKSSSLSVKYYKQGTARGTISGTIMFIAFSLQTFGAKYTSPANNALCTGLYVIFVPCIGIVLFKRKNAFIYLAALVSFIGVALISGFSFRNITLNNGDLLSVLCGFFFAVHFIIMEKYTAEGNLPYYTIIQLLTVACTSLVVSLLFEQKEYTAIQWQNGLRWIFFLGIVSTSVTYMIQSFVQAKISAEKVSVISCSESLFAVIFSLVLGYSVMSIKLFAGAILILFSMVAVALYSSRGRC